MRYEGAIRVKVLLVLCYSSSEHVSLHALARRDVIEWCDTMARAAHCPERECVLTRFCFICYAASRQSKRGQIIVRERMSCHSPHYPSTYTSPAWMENLDRTWTSEKFVCFSSSYPLTTHTNRHLPRLRFTISTRLTSLSSFSRPPHEITDDPQ